MRKIRRRQLFRRGADAKRIGRRALRQRGAEPAHDLAVDGFVVVDAEDLGADGSDDGHGFVAVADAALNAGGAGYRRDVECERRSRPEAGAAVGFGVQIVFGRRGCPAGRDDGAGDIDLIGAERVDDAHRSRRTVHRRIVAQHILDDLPDRYRPRQRISLAVIGGFREGGDAVAAKDHARANERHGARSHGDGGPQGCGSERGHCPIPSPSAGLQISSGTFTVRVARQQS